MSYEVDWDEQIRKVRACEYNLDNAKDGIKETMGMAKRLHEYEPDLECYIEDAWLFVNQALTIIRKRLDEAEWELVKVKENEDEF